MIQALLFSGLLVLVYMLAIWLLSLALKDSSIVDIFWGPGFVLLAWFNLLRIDGLILPRQLLAALLISIWGLRLGIHIYRRNRGKAEDYRYARWREQAGASWWWRSLFKVFLLQGVILYIVAVPLVVIFASREPAALNWLDRLAVLVWGIGFYFEAVGDWQLARFKADPANQGKVLDSGLWRYTRHPNYFGDAVVWWGIYGLALAAGGWWSLFSPILMSFLLLRVSGVAMLEKDLRQNKPEYADYIRRTSAFIPRPPRD